MSQYDHSKVAHFIGGNSLDKAPAGLVTDFVKQHGGHTVITKVLIANNGIAAVKEIPPSAHGATKHSAPNAPSNLPSWLPQKT